MLPGGAEGLARIEERIEASLGTEAWQSRREHEWQEQQRQEGFQRKGKEARETMRICVRWRILDSRKQAESFFVFVFVFSCCCCIATIYRMLCKPQV